MSAFDAARFLAACRADPSVVQGLGDVTGAVLMDLAAQAGMTVSPEDLRRAYAADWLLRGGSTVDPRPARDGGIVTTSR